MKRILCVLLNDWPITVAGRRRARGRLGHQRDAIVIIRTVADRQVIVSASESAQALHIRAGMTLTEARALHAAVLHADHDPLRDAKSLEALARWMMRFTPTVSCITGVSPVPSASEAKDLLPPNAIRTGETPVVQGTHLFSWTSPATNVFSMA